VTHFLRMALIWISVVLFACVFQGCGGGKKGPVPSSLTGTAAVGAPIANAVVTVKDRNGVSKTGTTDALGKYRIDVTGLTAPFLLKVDLSSGSSLFSVGIHTGNVNIHPFTDLIIGTWYQIKGLKVLDAFAGMGSSTPLPTEPEVSILANVAKDIVWRWVNDHDLNPQTFDLITTPFNADGAGFDAVLALSQIDASGVVTIQDSSMNETSTLSFDSSTSTLAVNTTTTSGQQATNSITTVVIPTTAAIQTAFNGVNATLLNVVGKARTEGLFLADTDLARYFDDNYIQDGFGKDVGTADFASLLRGVALQLKAFTVDRIVSYDDSDKVIHVVATFSWAQDGQILYRVVDKGEGGIGFKQQADGSWRFFGNQQVANVQAQAIMVQIMAGGTSDGAYPLFQLQAIAPTGKLISAQAANSTTTIPLIKASTVFVDTLYPEVGSSMSLQLDQFGVLLPVPSIGELYTFNLTTNTNQLSYTDLLRSMTTESIRITSPTGHTLNDALLGQSLTVEWTLPTTFPIGQVDLIGQITVGQSVCTVNSPFPGPSSTSGTITLPTTCEGASVVPGVTSSGSDPVILQVRVRGVNGEETWVQYHFR